MRPEWPKQQLALCSIMDPQRCLFGSRCDFLPPRPQTGIEFLCRHTACAGRYTLYALKCLSAEAFLATGLVRGFAWCKVFFAPGV